MPTSGLKAALQTRLAEAIQCERDAAAQQDEHDDAGEGQHEAETDGAPGTLLEDGSAEVSGGVDATRGAHDTGGGHAPGASSTEQHIDDAFAAFEFAFRNSGSRHAPAPARPPSCAKACSPMALAVGFVVLLVTGLRAVSCGL